MGRMGRMEWDGWDEWNGTDGSDRTDRSDRSDQSDQSDRIPGAAIGDRGSLRPHRGQPQRPPSVISETTHYALRTTHSLQAGHGVSPAETTPYALLPL